MIVALISPDDNVRVRLQEALESDGDFEAVWSLSEYPDRNALDCCIDRLDGCIVVLDFSRTEKGAR